ncbi:MAG: hypothetical protein K0Q43_5047 [Ramlibacter sp.]|jgi:hypothetical protein|nr:hypothetical protein [Ramlibacter sp.]
MATQYSEPHSLSPSESELDLKRDLLRVVLSTTLKKNGVPPQWIAGEINAMSLPTGELRIEVRLSVQVDEPRLLAFLTSFQADFERRLLGIAPDAKHWVSGIVWSLTPDPIFEVALPTPDYWEQVIADRELTARQKGAVVWDRAAMERHFLETSPGELLVDFDDTHPPPRGVEDLAPPPKK